VVVLVGVSDSRRAVLEKNGLAVPAPVPVRAQIDTGSHVTGFMPSVFKQLRIERFDVIPLRTPSTKPNEPHLADRYHVSLALVSGLAKKHLPSVFAIASDDFVEEEEVQAIIGRDVLRHCVFQYFGPHGTFELGF